MERLKEFYWCISQIPRTASIPCEIEPPWHAQLSSYDEMCHAQLSSYDEMCHAHEERKVQGTNRTSKIRHDEVGIELVPKMLWMCSSKTKNAYHLINHHRHRSTCLMFVCLHVCQKINTNTFEKGSYKCTVKKSSVNGKWCLFHSLIQVTTSCIQECVLMIS